MTTKLTTALIEDNPTFNSNVTVGKLIAPDISITNNITTQNILVTGNLTVQGNTITVNSETVLIADNFVSLNSNQTGSPTENAGIEVNRGSSSNVQIRWNESTDTWQFSNDGSTYNNISSVSTGKSIAMSIVFGG